MDGDTKTCTLCNKIKPLTSFHKERGGRKSRCISCRRRINSSYKKTVHGRFSMYKSSAKERSIDFNISIDSFKKLVSGSCNYCGTTDGAIGIDRVDNSSGYTEANVVSCCSSCNYFKHTMSVSDFLLHVSKIYMHQKEKRDDK